MIFAGYGEVGSYTHQYYEKIKTFQDSYVTCESFMDAYKSVSNGEADALILPVENSYVGKVPDAQAIEKLACQHFLLNKFLSGSLAIQHALIGYKGMSLDDVQEVLSYPFVFSQCRKNIAKYNFGCKDHQGTASAVVDVVLKAGGFPHRAAIGPKDTAIELGGDVLLYPFNDCPNNRTYFAVYEKPVTTSGLD